MGPYPEGTSATLICTSGFPTGPSTAICTNTMWSPAFFSGCSTNGVGAGGWGTTNVWSNVNNGFGVTSNGAFGGQSCSSPVNTVAGGTVTYSNGAVFGPYPSGTIASLVCQNGQLASGSITASCQSGFWQPASLGQCGNTFG